MTDHKSDCAVHNEPALPAGPCDCGADSRISVDSDIMGDNTDIEIQPIQGDPVVRVFRTYTDDGAEVYDIYTVNAVDGECA